MTAPEPLPNESAKAFNALKTYAAMGPKRSLVKVAHKLGISRQLIERWSVRHQWQKRLRKLELEDCQRAIAADEAAKLSVAEERERERTLFQQRALEASRKATERGLQILKESAKGSKPSDAARLLAVGDAIGRAALGLSGTAAPTGHFGLHPTSPPNIRVVIEEGESSRRARKLEDEFFEKHPNVPPLPDPAKLFDAILVDKNGVARRARDDP